MPVLRRSTRASGLVAAILCVAWCVVPVSAGPLLAHIPGEPAGWWLIGVAAILIQGFIIALLWINRRKRIRAEAASRRSEQFTSSILDSLAAHVAVLDTHGRIISVNAAWRRFAEENGLSAADHGVGADYLKVCESSGMENAPEARQVAHAIRQLLSSQLNDFRLAYPCHSPDRQRWFQTHLRRLRCPEDGQSLIVVAHEEITELHTISEALHRSEERYRRLVEGMGVIIWEADPLTFTCTYVSNRAATLLGFPLEDWYQPGFWLDHIHPDDREKVDAYSRQCVARLADHRLEYRMNAADGRTVWFEDLVSIEARHGKVARIRGVMIDITERKTAELALAAGTARLRAILESEPECVKTVSPDGRLLEMNAAGLRMIEADSFEQVRGHSVLSLILPDDRPVFSGLHQAALDGRSASAQFRIIGVGGTLRWVDSSSVPLRGPDGAIEAVLSLTRDITARREIETRLRESEHRFRQLFEENMAGVFYSTTSGKVQGCNQAFARIFGFDSPEAALAVPAVDFYLHPDDRSRYIEDLRRAGRLTSYEIRMRRKDGTPIWLLENVQLLPASDGDGDFIFGTFIDITARKEAEQALAESEERFRGIFEHADVGIARVSIDGRFRQVNPALCRMLGYTEAELTSRTFASLTHPDDLSPNMELFHQVLRGERDSYYMEKRYLRADGGIVWASLTVVAVHDEHGHTTGLIPVIEDITTRKRAEQELMGAHDLLEQRVRDRTAQLAESEERFRALHEATFEGLAICEGAIIREANEALVEMFGYSRDELLGRTVFSLISPESREEAESFDAVGELASADASEFLGLHRDGRTFPIELRTKEMPFRGGRARVIAIRDISARRRAEETIERHRDELAHLQRLATANELASGLAHEINQPLCSVVNYVSGCVHRLRTDPACGADLVGILRQAVAQAERASGIVRWMREFVRKRSIEKADVDLNRVVERAAGMIRREAAQLGISVRLRLHSDLPRVPVDEIQIEQVVLNLLKNACEALGDAPPGRRSVALATDSLPGFVRLRVSDTGRGIDPPLADRIFEPFVSSKTQGMGLGLSISRSIVEAHGGRLTLERGLEEGTVFLLTLPVQFLGASNEQHHRSGEADRLHSR